MEGKYTVDKWNKAFVYRLKVANSNPHILAEGFRKIIINKKSSEPRPELSILSISFYFLFLSTI